jgi:endoglucanase
MNSPASRVNACYEQPTNPACARAWQANPQALYDWTEVNIPDAAGRHRLLIPDGKLCSAGREKYAAFDNPSTQWPATRLKPDADGKFTLKWTSTAPHATAYYRIYLTTPSFDPRKPLKWSDLKLVHDSGPRAAAPETVIRTALPQRQGRQIMYTIWQRSDSTEAFYACSDVIIDAPAATSVEATLPLHIEGSDIKDSAGNTVVLHGVNWFGLETSAHAPHGLWKRDYKDMLQQIADIGFNTVRVPFSLEALGSSTTSGIDFANGRNAELKGKTPLQVLDAVITEAARHGLMIILDNHSQADDGYMYPLWFGQAGYTEADWIAMWKKLAARYADQQNVIAFDLKNEPHGSASWGTGGSNDWRRAARVAGNAVLRVNPRMLIVIEGIEAPVAGGTLERHWWGGNLEGVRKHPVRLDLPNRVIYSPHEYGPEVFAQPWFADANMSRTLAQRWQAGFGYIIKSHTAPVLVGEFGAKDVSISSVEGRWFRQFADYLSDNSISWTYWAWNPNSGDTGGILKDDWSTVHNDKLAVLRAVMAGQHVEFEKSNPVPVPKPDPTPSTTPATSALKVQRSITSDWGSGYCASVRMTSDSAAPVRWRKAIAVDGSITEIWNAKSSTVKGSPVFSGLAWNNTVQKGSPVEFGYCGLRGS